MKYYILQRIGHEYNDEIYSCSGNGDGKPEEVFLSKEKAQDAADRMNFQEMKGLQISDYGYEPEGFLNDIQGFLNVYNETFNANLTLDNLCDFSLPGDMSFSQFKQLKPFISIAFYEVVECEGEGVEQKK
jgi:hypothetical protein